MGFAFFLMALNVVTYFLVRFNVVDEIHLSLFDLDGEGNLPTYFATVLLLLASVVLLLIGLQGKQKYYWYLLSGVFCFLSLDESIQIHEKFNALTKSALGLKTYGAFYFAWVIPYGILTLLLLVFLYRFIWTLPKRTRTLFIISGIIFVSGALGLEMVAAGYVEKFGYSARIYKLLAFSEEALEMIGVSLFIFALLDYVENTFDRLVISVQRKAPFTKNRKTVSSEA